MLVNIYQIKIKGQRQTLCSNIKGFQWRSAHFLPKPGFHVFILWRHRDCPGNTARMATAGFSRLKPRSVTCEDELGSKPSPGKFTLTPSWLVSSTDLSLQMAQERRTGSGNINIIFHIFTLGNLKMTDYISHTKREDVKDKKNPLLAHVGELHDKSMNRCRILHTKQMTSSPCKASRMKLLANEREQVWISMSALQKKKEQRRKIYKQMLNFMYKNYHELLQNILKILQKRFDGSK